MRIAFLGIRGVPASYSGFETCAEQLGERLVRKGHAVTVYNRAHHITYRGKLYKGMRLIRLPTIRNKYLDTIVHSFLSSLHALFAKYDVALYFIAGNSVVSWIPRLVGTKTVINVDGLDWRRDKWPGLAKKYIQFAELMATKLPTVCVTDSRSVQAYYQEHYHYTPHYIPYGADVPILPPGETLHELGLRERCYVLFVGRLVPENCAHHLIEAFKGLDTDMKCVIVGDAPYAQEYIRSLRDRARNDDRIVFTGYRFGEDYWELGSNAYVFVETSGVGGTHPALLEAMAFGNCVVFQETPENIETVGDAGIPYRGKDGANHLRQVLARLISNPGEVAEYRARAKRRAELFSWDSVADAYETLFRSILGQES